MSVASQDDAVVALQTELHRQKVVFESELRRQRETFEAKISDANQRLRARESDCRNLQSVVTILGRKLDELSDVVGRLSQRSPTRRCATPTRGGTPSGAVSRTASVGRPQSPSRSTTVYSRNESYARAPSLNTIPAPYPGNPYPKATTQTFNGVTYNNKGVPLPSTTVPLKQPDSRPGTPKHSQRPPSPGRSIALANAYKPILTGSQMTLRGPTPTRVAPTGQQQ